MNKRQTAAPERRASTKKRAITVALCGVGSRLSYVAKILQKKIPGFTIIAHADPSVQRRRVVTQEDANFGAPYASLDKLLQAETPELVMIGSPNAMHLGHIKSALQSEARIWCEKPVVTTVAQSLEMARLVQLHGANRIMVGLVLRYAPLYQALVKAKSDGVFGDIISIEAAEHITPEHGAFFMRDWRRNPLLSGGFLLEKCCHDLDLYQSIVAARPKRVASFGGRRIFTPKNKELNKLPMYHMRKSHWGGSDKVFDGDSQLIDHQVALIEYENDATLCFHTNLHVPDEFRRFCILGSRGMAEGDFTRKYLRIHDAITANKIVEERYDYDDDISQHYGAEEKMAEELMKHFYEGAPLPVSIINALEAGLTAMKIDEARCTGKILELDDCWQTFDEALGNA